MRGSRFGNLAITGKPRGNRPKTKADTARGGLPPGKRHLVNSLAPATSETLALRGQHFSSDQGDTLTPEGRIGYCDYLTMSTDKRFGLVATPILTTCLAPSIPWVEDFAVRSLRPGARMRFPLDAAGLDR